MKTILMVCDRANIDRPLRRSLAHLVKSCQIEIAADGYEAFQELLAHAFDLVVIDFEIAGLDSLELIDSIGYVDPGVPIIVMLKQEHKAVWGDARFLRANPILRPFKPLVFLRLVDTLLHQHLERYRELSETMAQSLSNLNRLDGVSFTFLVDDSGQVLQATTDLDNELMQTLGRMASLQQKAVDEQYLKQFEKIVAASSREKDHDLYIAPVIDSLLLGVLAQGQPGALPSDEVWRGADEAARHIRQAIAESAYIEDLLSNDVAGETSVPLKLSDQPELASESEPLDVDEEAVNWAIISGQSGVLSRLQDILSEY
jgi:DNA-binding NarL/FixJ family response regulator